VTSITLPVGSLLRRGRMGGRAPLRPWMEALPILVLAALLEELGLDFRPPTLLLLAAIPSRSAQLRYDLICLVALMALLPSPLRLDGLLILLGAIASALAGHQLLLGGGMEALSAAVDGGTLGNIRSCLEGLRLGWAVTLVLVAVQVGVLTHFVGVSQAILFLAYHAAVLYGVQAFLVGGWRMSALTLLLLPYALSTGFGVGFSTLLGLTLSIILLLGFTLLTLEADYHILNAQA